MAVVRRWVEVASPEEIAEAIDIPSAVGTALCMAAALKKDHEIGKARSQNFEAFSNVIRWQPSFRNCHELCFIN